MLTSDQWTLNTVRGDRLELTGVPRQSRLPSQHLLNARQLALVEDEIVSLLDKNAIKKVPYHRERFYSNLFLVEKKGGWATPCDKLVRTKLICASPSFQDGGLEGGCRHSSSSRLYVQNRPQGRILCCSHPPNTPEATLLSVQECILPVHMPALRSQIRTSGLHKSVEALGCLRQEIGYKDMHLHRRHVNLEFSQGGSFKRCIPHDPLVRESGLCCEYGEIYSVPFTGSGIPRCSGQLHPHELFPPRQQSLEPATRLQKASTFQEHLTVRSSTFNWQNDCSKGSCIPGSSALQGTATPEELSRPPGSSPPSEGNSRYRGYIRSRMVDNQPEHSQLQAGQTPPSGHTNPVGCLGLWLGAVCNGLETRGTWSLQESALHINCLELLAATYAIKAFTKTLSNAHDLIQIDNTSAIAYINKMGGAKQGVLDQHARTLWEWSLARKITLRAEHIPGRLNVIADAESRAKPDAADWKLDSEVFQVLNQRHGPFTIDLFANRNNSQLERFYSYLPDPLAEQFDALVQPWREENAYAFPPFNLISKCLRKTSLEVATLLIICPVWPAQPWYPHLLRLLTDNPLLLPTHDDLLLDPLGNRHPMVINNSLPLAGWKVSGNTSLQRAYQKKLQRFSSLTNADQQMLSTSPVGQSGVAGVINDRLIPFDQL